MLHFKCFLNSVKIFSFGNECVKFTQVLLDHLIGLILVFFNPLNFIVNFNFSIIFVIRIIAIIPWPKIFFQRYSNFLLFLHWFFLPFTQFFFVLFHLNFSIFLILIDINYFLIEVLQSLLIILFQLFIVSDLLLQCLDPILLVIEGPRLSELFQLLSHNSELILIQSFLRFYLVR